MAGIRRFIQNLTRQTEVQTRQAENTPVLRDSSPSSAPTEVTGVPISSLPGASTPGSNDVVPGVQSDTTKKFKLGDLLAWIKTQLSPADIGAVGASDVGVAGGVAELDANGKVPSAQLPAIPSDADEIGYDNTTSGLTATDVQTAIDEVVVDVGGKQPTINANGILKGDGQGGVSAAVAGTDYASASAVTSLNNRYTDNTLWISNSDANDYKPSGMYAMATGNANIPAAWGILFVIAPRNDTIEQEYRCSGNIWNREFRSNTWSTWTQAVKQSQLAYPESGTTASRNYSAGECICWNGLTYTANQAISIGTTLSAATNGNLTECVGGGFNGNSIQRAAIPLYNAQTLFTLARGFGIAKVYGGNNGTTAVLTRTEQGSTKTRTVSVGASSWENIPVVAGDTITYYGGPYSNAEIYYIAHHIGP